MRSFYLIWLKLILIWGLTNERSIINNFTLNINNFYTQILKFWRWIHYRLRHICLLIICTQCVWIIVPRLIFILKSRSIIYWNFHIFVVISIRSGEITFYSWFRAMMFSCNKSNDTTCAELTYTFKFIIMLDKIMLLIRPMIVTMIGLYCHLMRHLY